ncbi:polymorphic toxin type 8 domain-containing protein [Anoxybacillus sp. J5B_2022]|uniref:polymorphic toxin type 8 domain-containing protein n=1 Tax=Anoxybacillus sp. J5B_2022 TaxID=3003246 RepID=UPI0022854607|nr:polymorphic toxin type 8 domain-containing protein [Anoxybacillus sp. J5B_2022]MCZ0756212.1 polymorphic toxin type 8 domain-containing protein [Anoxybacillus sp. J5B_2022]
MQKRSNDNKHPTAYKAGQAFGHAVATIAGVMETTGSVAIGTGGVVLNATGVGAVIGTPATAIAAVGVAHGAGLTAAGGTGFSKSVKELYQQMSRSDGVSGGRGKRTENVNQSVTKNSGRSGKQARLKEIANDDKVSSALRGEIKRDMNEIAAGKRKNIRVPQGYELAHRRGYEARNGYGYEHSDLQMIKNHRTQHKHDGYGKKKKNNGE